MGNQKSKREIALQLLDWKLEEQKEFEKDYLELYNTLTKRYEYEFKDMIDQSSKSEFLQELMDIITSFQYNAKNNFILSERMETRKNGLTGLYRFFESENQKLYISSKQTPIDQQVLKPKKKVGRKKTKTLNAKEYLNIEHNKEKFLEQLKENYKDSEPNFFNCLIAVLKEKHFLKTASNKEIKESFEIAIEPKHQTQTNFNNQSKINHKTSKFYKEITSKINEIQLETLAI